MAGRRADEYSSTRPAYLQGFSLPTCPAGAQVWDLQEGWGRPQRRSRPTSPDSLVFMALLSVACADPTTGSTVDPAVPVPKENSAQECLPACGALAASPGPMAKFQACRQCLVQLALLWMLQAPRTALPRDSEARAQAGPTTWLFFSLSDACQSPLHSSNPLRSPPPGSPPRLSP